MMNEFYMIYMFYTDIKNINIKKFCNYLRNLKWPIS